MKRVFGCMVAAALLASCGDDPTRPTGPDPGPLLVRMQGPAGVGAVLMLVEGGTIDSVVARNYFTASTIYSGVARRVLVAGDNLGGVLVRVDVPDRRLPYKATIIQVADGATFQLRDSTAYALTVARP